MFELNQTGAQKLLSFLSGSYAGDDVAGGIRAGAAQRIERETFVDRMLEAGLTTGHPAKIFTGQKNLMSRPINIGGVAYIRDSRWEELQIRRCAGCPDEIEVVQVGVATDPSWTYRWFRWIVTTSGGFKAPEFVAITNTAFAVARGIAISSGHYGPVTIEAIAGEHGTRWPPK